MEEVYCFDSYSKVRVLLNVQETVYKKVTELNQHLLVMITLLKVFKVVLVLAYSLFYFLMCHYVFPRMQMKKFSSIGLNWHHIVY
jgi:hypothetical protein